MICLAFSVAEMISELLVGDRDSGGVWNWGGKGGKCSFCFIVALVELRVSFAWRAG